MLKALRQFFRPASGAGPAMPQGTRVYAIGDIHGRRDLLRALSVAIEADDQARGGAQTTVILLGDLIDRGPRSSEVLSAAQAWGRQRKVRVLMGNHEEMFLASLDDEKVFRSFMRFGGKETALSYPVDRAAFLAALDEAPAEAMAMMRAAVPERDIAFVRTFEPMISLGDYLFVHAGIRPGLPLDLQSPVELFWIREPFLSDPTDHGFVVVHGHTITAEPDIRPNRIGLDTGAFLTGRLTAMGFEGSERWLIEARDHDGTITTTTQPA
jgi:serine/threonine protein phosphatase 1